MKKLLLVLCCCALFDAVVAQGELIFTAAGNGNTGYTGDGGLADSAQLNFPTAVAFDAAGNFYITDRDNHVIRRVDVNNNITTFAGNGFPGIQGDGGLAIDAEFAAPYGVAVDHAGNVYISDEGVRKINVTTGIVNYVAGGGSTNGPDGGLAVNTIIENSCQIAFDLQGNLYVTDGRHFSIRKVDTAGIITTVAGNGTEGCSGDGGLATSAELGRPEGLVIDAAGNIFIADQENNNIRKVDAITHVISTICGDPFGRDNGYTGDGGAAHLATLAGPNYLALDALGQLYICDNQNEAIRKIGANGIISTIAGHNSNVNLNIDIDNVPPTEDRLHDPMGIAFSNAGNLFIAEAGNFKVRKLTNSATGINEASKLIALKSYPNPVDDVMYIETGGMVQGSYSVIVRNVAGQTIYLPYTAMGNKLQMNAGDIASGIYFVNIITSNGGGVVKFIKE